MFDIRKIVDVDDSNSVSAIQNRKLVTSENSTWQLQLSNKVSQVRVRSDDSMVYMLEFTMMDGSIKNGGYSSKASQPEAVFDIEPNDHIVRVEVNQGDSMYGLRIHTNKGRESGWYGLHTEVPQVFLASAEDPIVGFERGTEAVCPKLVRMQRLGGSMLEQSAPSTFEVPKHECSIMIEIFRASAAVASLTGSLFLSCRRYPRA
jgi:hypothetical protein